MGDGVHVANFIFFVPRSIFKNFSEFIWQVKTWLYSTLELILRKKKWPKTGKRGNLTLDLNLDMFRHASYNLNFFSRLAQKQQQKKLQHSHFITKWKSYLWFRTGISRKEFTVQTIEIRDEKKSAPVSHYGQFFFYSESTLELSMAMFWPAK